MTAYAELSRPVRLIRGSDSTIVARFSKGYAVVPARRSVSLPKLGGLVTLFLVGTLLLCHGVLGFTDEMSRWNDWPHPMQISAMSGEHSAGHTGGHKTDDPSCGHLSAGYLAVVLILVGAAMLGFLLGGPKQQRRTVSPPWRSRFLPTFTYLPRGPTLALLQLIRQ